MKKGGFIEQAFLAVVLIIIVLIGAVQIINKIHVLQEKSTVRYVIQQYMHKQILEYNKMSKTAQNSQINNIVDQFDMHQKIIINSTKNFQWIENQDYVIVNWDGKKFTFSAIEICP